MKRCIMPPMIKQFVPTEIIFSPTDECNLRCAHCFVRRASSKIDADDALKFIDSCAGSSIQYVGFSGGEPFLRADFIAQVVKKAVSENLMFDRIMTNGDWWKSEAELKSKLTAVYQAGYDGKIGLSWDAFHNQDFDRLLCFIKTAHNVFGTQSVEIQSVAQKDDGFLGKLKKLSAELGCAFQSKISRKSGCGICVISSESVFLAVNRTRQSFSGSDEKRAWQSGHWFKDDFCSSMGQILFVTAEGSIAPCCGFANENPALTLGNIKQTFPQIMQNASRNRMIKICFEQGLKSQIKPLKKRGIRFPEKGKTQDICAFCDFVCRLTRQN